MDVIYLFMLQGAQYVILIWVYEIIYLSIYLQHVCCMKVLSIACMSYEKIYLSIHLKSLGAKSSRVINKFGAETSWAESSRCRNVESGTFRPQTISPPSRFAPKTFPPWSFPH